MRIVLKKGESITVAVDDGDGEITVAYEETRLIVSADMADSTGREGIIYEENFGRHVDDRTKREIEEILAPYDPEDE